MPLAGKAAMSFLESLETQDVSPDADAMPYVRVLRDVCWGRNPSGRGMWNQNRVLFSFGKAVDWPRREKYLRAYREKARMNMGFLTKPRALPRRFDSSKDVVNHVDVMHSHAALLYAGHKYSARGKGREGNPTHFWHDCMWPLLGAAHALRDANITTLVVDYDTSETPSTAPWRNAMVDLLRLELGALGTQPPEIIRMSQSMPRERLVCFKSVLTTDNSAEFPFFDAGLEREQSHLLEYPWIRGLDLSISKPAVSALRARAHALYIKKQDGLQGKLSDAGIQHDGEDPKPYCAQSGGIYVHVRTARKKILNPSEIAKAARKATILPVIEGGFWGGKDSFAKQVADGAKAAIVFTTHGAQLANTIWMNPGAVVVEVSAKRKCNNMSHHQRHTSMGMFAGHSLRSRCADGVLKLDTGVSKRIADVTANISSILNVLQNIDEVMMRAGCASFMRNLLNLPYLCSGFHHSARDHEMNTDK
eukprot:gene9952-11783_t